MKWPTATVAALVTFGVITCGGPIEEEELPEVYAKNWCQRSKQCDTDFDSRFDSRAECEEVVADWVELGVGFACIFGDYDGQAARDCVRGVNEGNCADFLDRDPEDDIPCEPCG